MPKATAWFAHSLDGQPEDAWEPLERHLREVGYGAGERASKFGASGLGAAAGMLHDLGKYKPEFLARIRGSAAKVDHASAGANHARPFGVLGRLLAHVIAGHHAGLSDGLFARGGRLDQSQPELARIQAVARADGLVPPASLAQPDGFRAAAGLQGFQLAFLARMLFSCLVDADRAATAAFEERALGTPRTLKPRAGMEDLSNVLGRWMDEAAAERVRTGAADSPVNRLRAEVLAHVLGQASAAPDTFTLTVPTGGGKTLTSLAFALEHARINMLDRVVFVIPFTSVVEQTAAAYRGALPGHASQILEHHSAFDETTVTDREDRGMLRLAMESWNAPVVVTTAVQFFESLFSNRPARCRKLHNLSRSVIVLDEAQTLPLHVLRPCVAALQELARNYGSTIVLCTATQPALQERPADPGHSFPGDFQAQELAPDPPRLFAALRRVVIHSIGEQDDPALAARLGQDTALQALCIVNQRKHARDLFRAIGHLSGARHLSTWMHAAHRARVLAHIREDLKAGRPCRVVATSLVEAGVDLDFPLVLRAEAGLDSVAQAAGRCNREGRRDLAASEVLVFRAANAEAPKSLRANVETGRAMLRRFAADPLSPEAVEAYFQELYWRKGAAELDRGGALGLCENAKASQDFPFSTIAEAVRLIDDAALPVIVPVEDGGKAGKLLRALKHVDHPGRIARSLQRFTVGVPSKVRAALIAQGLATPVEPGTFGDQFVQLLHLDLYRPDVGLDWSDPTFVDAGRLMV